MGKCVSCSNRGENLPRFPAAGKRESLFRAQIGVELPRFPVFKMVKLWLRLTGRVSDLLKGLPGSTLRLLGHSLKSHHVQKSELLRFYRILIKC